MMLAGARSSVAFLFVATASAFQTHQPLFGIPQSKSSLRMSTELAEIEVVNQPSKEFLDKKGYVSSWCRVEPRAKKNSCMSLLILTFSLLFI
jgi:hypothetical protein